MTYIGLQHEQTPARWQVCLTQYATEVHLPKIYTVRVFR